MSFRPRKEGLGICFTGYRNYNINMNFFLSLLMLPPSSKGTPAYSALRPLFNLRFSLTNTHLNIAAKKPTNSMKPAQMLMPLT